jgi:hypothetical protein
MAGNFIALCNENEEAPLVVIAGRESISLGPAVMALPRFDFAKDGNECQAAMAQLRPNSAMLIGLELP